MCCNVHDQLLLQGICFRKLFLCILINKSTSISHNSKTTCLILCRSPMCHQIISEFSFIALFLYSDTFFIIDSINFSALYGSIALLWDQTRQVSFCFPCASLCTLHPVVSSLVVLPQTIFGRHKQLHIRNTPHDLLLWTFSDPFFT